MNTTPERSVRRVDQSDCARTREGGAYGLSTSVLSLVTLYQCILELGVHCGEQYDVRV